MEWIDCENVTKCLQGVNSLINTAVCEYTIVEIFTLSMFLYCFDLKYHSLTNKGWLSRSHPHFISR